MSDKRPLTKEEIRANKRVVRQVTFQMRYSASRKDGQTNIDRMMRDNRSVCG